ncbi:MAG: DUF488 domain-containing protein [Chloroflexi bacterium]|nr:DUF488 domain-containing protein [Chloroflexota bacterium]MCY3582873.1 DUF488 domain-containing protein [Chloroflexota bacterium]MCY3716932.1 DUF488 domain-containing protein [Chloroflexota bacterium]MDE2649835.1 DUF488 domain-containing protein [Chloroflexota bacterium]MXX84534.1 DUF488 domain-containing protein [Chloroflexota bacterium]
MTKIYTIGYGGRSSGDFVALLRRYDIALLVDVRSQPYSKFNPDFTRSALTRILRDAGIDYVFLGEALGGRPSDEDCFVDGLLNAERCEERAWYRQGIRRLKSLAAQRRSAIMCSEKDPAHCHRSYTIGVTLQKDASCAVLHIDKSGALKDQAALQAEAKPRQLDMLF